MSDKTTIVNVNAEAPVSKEPAHDITNAAKAFDATKVAGPSGAAVGGEKVTTTETTTATVTAQKK